MLIMRNNTPVELTNDEILAASKAYTKKQIENLLLHHINDAYSNMSKDEKFKLVELMTSSALEKCALMTDEIIKRCVDDEIKEYQKDVDPKPCYVKVVFYDQGYEMFKELAAGLESTTFQSKKYAIDAINDFIMEIFSENPNHTYAIRKSADKNSVEVREKGSTIIKVTIEIAQK